MILHCDINPWSIQWLKLWDCPAGDKNHNQKCCAGQLYKTNGSSEQPGVILIWNNFNSSPWIKWNNDLRALDRTLVHMCGLTAHTVQLHDCGLFLADKNNMQKRSLPMKQVTGKSPASSAGWNPEEIQSGRRLTQFFGQRGNSVICSTPAPVISPLIAANYFTVPQTEVAFPRAVKSSRVRDGAPRVNFSAHLTGSILTFKNK